MRIQRQTIAHLRQYDPDMTAHALRRMVLSGQVPSVRVGNKYLLDLDRLPEYLTADPVVTEPERIGNIRRIAE